MSELSAQQPRALDSAACRDEDVNNLAEHDAVHGTGCPAGSNVAIPAPPPARSVDVPQTGIPKLDVFRSFPDIRTAVVERCCDVVDAWMRGDFDPLPRAYEVPESLMLAVLISLADEVENIFWIRVNQ